MTEQTALSNMIKQQLRTNNVLAEPILDLFDLVPRHEFVPAEYAAFAYSDMQIPLPQGQKMMSPMDEGVLLQALNLSGKETVLEVGTGSGFFTAMLSKMAARVISVDFFPEMTQAAAKKLAQHHCDNVTLITGDACRGWLELAPYDAVIFTGGIETVTDTHKLQVLPGGQLFVLVGRSPVYQGQLHKLDHDNQWSHELLFETDLPPLIDKLKPKAFIF